MRTLADRAARYVGGEDRPRISIMVSPRKVLIVWKDGYCLLYSEDSGTPNAIHFMLTDQRRNNLHGALDQVDV